jgi:hypothetical protein
LHETYESAIACQQRTIQSSGPQDLERVLVDRIETFSIFARLRHAISEGARQTKNGTFMFYLGLAQMATMFILSLMSTGLIGPVSYIVGLFLTVIGVVRITLHSLRFWPYTYRHFELIR